MKLTFRAINTVLMLLIAVFSMSCKTRDENSIATKDTLVENRLQLTRGNPAAGLCPEGYIDTCTMKAAPNLEYCGCVPKTISCEADANCPRPMKCARNCDTGCANCAKKYQIIYRQLPNGHQALVNIKNVKIISLNEKICTGKSFAVEFEAINISNLAISAPPAWLVSGTTMLTPKGNHGTHTPSSCWDVTAKSAVPVPLQSLPVTIKSCPPPPPIGEPLLPGISPNLTWSHSWAVNQARVFRVDFIMDKCPANEPDSNGESTINWPLIDIYGFSKGALGSPTMQRMVSIVMKCTTCPPCAAGVCCENIVNSECKLDCEKCKPKSDFKNCTGDEFMELWDFGGSCSDKTYGSCDQ